MRPDIPMTMTKKSSDMTFFEHLGELRKRILYSIGYIALFFIVAWNFREPIYHWMSKPLLHFMPGTKLAYTAITEPFIMYMKMAAIGGLFAASPFIFHQLWLFISPALYPTEKKWVTPFVALTTFFFFIGGAFGYYVLFPAACKFFLEMGKDFTPIITIDRYFSLAFQLLFGIALVFEVPVVIFLLAKLRLVTAAFLWKYFRFAIVMIFIIAAVITPTPDPFNQALLAAPMVVLYFISIGIAAWVNPKARKTE
jgi:sec-independent protein translocase protein TatC